MPGQRDQDIELSKFEAYKLQMEIHRLNNEQNKALEESWKLALRYAVLLNAGAAVPLLGFLGIIMAKGLTDKDLLATATVPAALFAVGALLASVSALAGFKRQMSTNLEFWAERDRSYKGDRNESEALPNAEALLDVKFASASRKHRELSRVHWKIAVFMVQASLAVFAAGVLSSVYLFVDYISSH